MTPAPGRQGVAAAVAASFAAAAGETLDTLRRTESSLRRLKKTRAAEGGAGDAGALSDVDKVGRQLLLDAQARPPVGAMPACARLQRCVLVRQAMARASALPRHAASAVMETGCKQGAHALAAEVLCWITCLRHTPERCCAATSKAGSVLLRPMRKVWMQRAAVMFHSVPRRSWADKRRRSAWRQANCQSTGACCLQSRRQTCEMYQDVVSSLYCGLQHNLQRNLRASLKVQHSAFVSYNAAHIPAGFV